jgi:hypothetical protein
MYVLLRSNIMKRLMGFNETWYECYSTRNHLSLELLNVQSVGCGTSKMWASLNHELEIYCGKVCGMLEVLAWPYGMCIWLYI